MIWYAIAGIIVVLLIVFRRAVLNFIWHLQDVYHVLKPCRFSLVVAIIGALIFLKVEQGREVLRALAEPGTLTGATGTVRFNLFLFGLLLWALVSWYAARVLLYFDFPKSAVWHPPRTGIWGKLHELLPQHVPRILGVLPLVIISASCFSIRHSYEKNAPPTLLWLGLGSLVAAGLLYYLFVVRRRLLLQVGAYDAGFNPKIDNHAPVQTYGRLSELERDTLVALSLMVAVSVVMSLMFIFNPVRFAGAVGTGAVLMFAAASWTFWGSAAVYLGSWRHLPVITFVLVWIAVCSFGNDNHDVRVVRREPFTRPPLKEALHNWNTNIAKYGNDRPHPLFIIASEGGGIRAAYWTATVLGSIEDANRTFADHVFAISGVSGGSVGAAVFDALLAEADAHRNFPPTGIEQLDKRPFATRGQTMLGQDFLSPALAAMLYPDLFQRFLPCRFLFLDRGRTLEHGWENAWQNTMHTDRFARSFLNLWEDRQKYIPALFLNGTSVEAGNRIIASNILVGEDFEEAADAIDKLLPVSQHAERRHPKIDMPLSTAAHMSARFTYVSPAGRFAPDGSHVVDGGYFENSGAATALDILYRVSDVVRKEPQVFRGVIPQIIMISNDPLGVGSGTRRFTATREFVRQVARTASNEAAKRQPGTFMEDALAPVYALLAAREARGEYAQRAIGQEEDDLCASLTASLNVSTPGKNCQYFFGLQPSTVPLPLGWMLSNGAANAIQHEMFDDDLSAKTAGTWNRNVLEQIVDVLPPPLP